jgi:hypothetical protein
MKGVEDRDVLGIFVTLLIGQRFAVERNSLYTRVKLHSNGAGTNPSRPPGTQLGRPEVS